MNNQIKPVSEDTARRLVDLLAKAPINTATKSIELAKKPVLQIRNNQILVGILGTSGLVIFALGIENLITNIPGLSTPLVEITLGLILLSVSGLLLKKLG